VSDSVKVEVLLPSIQDLVDNPSHVLSSSAETQLEAFATLVVSSFDLSAADDMNERSSPLWPVYLQTLRHYFKQGLHQLPLGFSFIMTFHLSQMR
jgi:hypothetical protein